MRAPQVEPRASVFHTASVQEAHVQRAVLGGVGGDGGGAGAPVVGLLGSSVGVGATGASVDRRVGVGMGRGVLGVGSSLLKSNPSNCRMKDQISCQRSSTNMDRWR